MDLPATATTDPGAARVPVESCTLPTAEQPLRVAEFDALFAASLRAVERPVGAATHARFLLAGDADLRDRVQRLADAETACCSFFTFTVTSLAVDGEAPAVIALDVDVPVSHADVLSALVRRAKHGRRTTA